MTNLETVAAQRDELAAKVRVLGLQLQAANDEIALLKGARIPPDGYRDGGFIPDVRAPEIPAVTPPKSKRPRIFGGKS